MTRGAQLLRHSLRALALASAAACSDKAPLPAQLPDCDSGTMCGSTGGQGSGGTPGDSGGASCGTIVFPTATCNACVRGMCCERNARCSANPVCLELLRCVNTCAPTSTTCRRACRDLSQNGIADYDNFFTCIDTGCTTSCAATDAGSMCGSIVFANMACNTCMNTNCCSNGAACSNNPDCFALVQCVSACPAIDQACRMVCVAQHQNGSAEYTSMTQCAQTSCSTECR